MGDVSSMVHNNHEKEKYSVFEKRKQRGPWFHTMYFA
jgi:hypothetical protein